MSTYNVDEVLKNIFDHEDSTWKPSDKISLIIKEIETRKSELKTFLVGSDYDIQNIISESEELCSESKLLVDRLDGCKKEIEEETMAEIVKSIENYDTLSKELQCISFATNLVGDVIQCGKHLKEIDEGKNQQSFTRSVEAVCDLVQYLELPLDGFDFLDIATKTRETAQLNLDNLVDELFSEWSRLLYWEVKPSTRKTVVNIIIKFDESSNCYDMLKALEVSRKLYEKMTEFAQFLYKDVLKPIMDNECGVIVETNELVSITIMHRQNIKPSYDDVIGNYKQLFQFLSTKLDLNFKDDPDTTPMIMLGQHLRSRFADALIEDCLIDTIPNNINDLQTYGRITMQIEEFQRFLVTIKFFPADDSISILKYVENIDILFADKASCHLLEQARTIMMKDLSDTMSIGVEKIPDESFTRSDNEALNILEKTIPKSLFYFPRCMISKSAQELLDLIHMIMEQAVQCPDVVCKKLYTTTRLIFELYDAVVPYHHEKYLQTIPQYVALFHNNCMYLAHSLQWLGSRWSSSGEADGAAAASFPLAFLDLVHKLRALAAEHLAAHMQHQRKQILDNIRSSDLNCIALKDELGDNAEAAVRQCLRQLQVLRNVWIGVMATNVYVRLMGTLVNMFVSELVHRVCSAEDISMKMAAQLADMYSILDNKAPALFPAPAHRQHRSEDMQQHVASWPKLQELVFVLGASLSDIGARWGEGRGPLAQHFSTEELRSLVKALFQNTQIRANLLSKIK